MQKILQLAIEKARELPRIKGQQRHAAILADKRGKIVSIGFNSYTCTHPIMHKESRKLGMYKDYLHSEVDAVLKDKHNKGYSLYIARVGASGEPLHSAPCVVCYSVIKQKKNIKQIFYT